MPATHLMSVPWCACNPSSTSADLKSETAFPQLDWSKFGSAPAVIESQSTTNFTTATYVVSFNSTPVGILSDQIQFITLGFAAATIQVTFPGTAAIIFFVEAMQFWMTTPGLLPLKSSKFAPRIPPTAEYTFLQETEPPNQQSAINETGSEFSHWPIRPPTVSTCSSLVSVLTTIASEPQPFTCVPAVHWPIRPPTILSPTLFSIFPLV